MEQRKYKTKAEVLARGQEAVGKTLGEIDKTGASQQAKVPSVPLWRKAGSGISPIATRLPILRKRALN